MYVFRQELCLWKIGSWYCETDTARAHNFLVLVSPHFLMTAKEMEYKKERLQEIARGILKEAGFKIQDYEKFLRFGEFGIVHFEVPGNACWLSMNINEPNILKNGAKLPTHNVDHSYQQSALMALWFFWAGLVESNFRRNNEE